MNDINTPFITVIIPVFNLEGIISKTINSVLSQTYQDFEILVINDASTDNSESVLLQFKLNYPSKIHLLQNTHKKGASGARNTGIYHANGQWIAFLDGDDLWDKHCLEERMHALDKYPYAEFISTDYMRFSETIQENNMSHACSNKHWNKYFSNSLKTGALTSIKKPINPFLEAALVSTCTLQVKSSILKKLGGFDETIPCYEDNQLWLRVAASVKQLIFIPKVLMFYRQREGSLTHSSESIYQHAPRAYQALLHDPLFNHYKAELKENITKFITLNCYFYRKDKQFLKSFQWGIQAIINTPLSTTSWKNFIASLFFR